MNNQNNNRTHIAYAITIKANPEKIFPLLCPVLEEKWIDGWNNQYQMIYSESGFNEKYCVFQENALCEFLLGEKGRTVWITTNFEPTMHSLEFTIVCGEQVLINLAVKIDAAENNSSSCKWASTVTFLRDSSNGESRRRFEVKLKAFTFFLARTLRHYCEKGEMLKGSIF